MPDESAARTEERGKQIAKSPDHQITKFSFVIHRPNTAWSSVRQASFGIPSGVRPEIS